MYYPTAYNYDNTGNIIDIYGKPVERTQWEWPYNYDDFCVWKGNFKETDSAVYSDRMREWGADKFKKCVYEVFGDERQLFYNPDPEDIEKFLCLYFKKNVTLTGIEQGCNQSSGYPYWIFFYREENSSVR